MSTSINSTSLPPAAPCTVVDPDMAALIDYVLEHEGDDFHEQLCEESVQPLDASETGVGEWTRRRDLWQEAKADNAEGEDEWWLARHGQGHIYCAAARLHALSRVYFGGIDRPPLLGTRLT